MRRPPELPEALTTTPFTLSGAKEHGLTDGQWRTRSWHTPHRGVRMAAPATTTQERAAAVAVILTKPFAFSHLTAARLWGLPLPTRWSTVEAIHVMRPSLVNSPDIVGVSAHRGLETRVVTQVKGLAVVGLCDTWCDLADCLDVLDLVIAADAIVNREGFSQQDVADAIARRGRRRGVHALRRALALCEPGAASPSETRVRVAYALGGLPKPEINADICNEDGEWLACVDILWRAKRLIAEVDGDYHRGRRQWQKDIHLRRRIVDAGWRIEVVTGEDALDAQRSHLMVERFRTLLR